MLRITRTVETLAVTLLAAAGGVEAQSFVAADWEIAVDDLGPDDGNGWGAAGEPIELLHSAALVVRVTDFDQDGDDDVLLGGNSGWGVRVHYLDSTVPGWVKHTEIFPLADVRDCYDVYVGLLNADPYPDVVVGRRLDCQDVTNGDRDKVFLNAGAPDANDDWFTVPPTSLPNPDADADASCLGETFSILIRDVDGDGNLDVIEAGNYGIHFLRGDGLGGFTWVKTYFDQGNQGNYRSMTFADVDGDGDGDEDMVAARMNGFITRIYFSRKNDPGFDPDDPFALAPNQPDLQWPALQSIGWQLLCGHFGTFGELPGTASVFGSDLADLDLDGDLDLVTANLQSRSAAYLNNGAGYFGSEDDAGVLPFNDGEPAFVFPALTPTFQGQSITMDAFLTGPGNPLPAAGPGCVYVWTMPGVYINHNTDVDVADVNGDGLPDVALSNRNDVGDAFDTLGELHLLPETFDFLFFNRSQGKGDVRFDRCVEMLGVANDGTGYGEFHHLNLNPGPGPGTAVDDRPEWFDANFANFGPSEMPFNRIWWGLPLVAQNCDQVDETGDNVPVDLHLSTRQEFVGRTWAVLGSATGMWPAVPPKLLGVDVPLVQDCLYNYLLQSGNLITGIVPDPPMTALQPSLPTNLACIGTDLFLALGLYDPGTMALDVTHPIRVPLSLP